MSERQPESKGRICALCGRPQDVAFRPFCSKRCADLDLARWLDGEYAIPGGLPSEDSPPDLEEGES